MKYFWLYEKIASSLFSFFWYQVKTTSFLTCLALEPVVGRKKPERWSPVGLGFTPAWPLARDSPPESQCPPLQVGNRTTSLNENACEGQNREFGIGRVCMLSHIRFLVTPWIAAHQAPQSMGFSRQEYWSGLPCPPLGDLLHPGIKPASLMSLALAGGFFATSIIWEAPLVHGT